MQGVRTKEVTIISDNEVSRWHNPVQYGSNTFFLELGSDAPPPPPGGGGWTRGGAGHGGARVPAYIPKATGPVKWDPIRRLSHLR